MARHEELQKLDIKSRNRLRSILSSGGDEAISRLNRLRSGLGKRQASALEEILASPRPIKAAAHRNAFPRTPPFKDALRGPHPRDMGTLLASIEEMTETNLPRLKRQITSIKLIDNCFSESKLDAVRDAVVQHIDEFGWSHALLRRIVLVREYQENEDDEIERLVWSAGLESKSIVVTSLIHAYAAEQNYLTVKRSTLNVADRGFLNRYSRNIARVSFQPFAKSEEDLLSFLGEVTKCSLLDAVILLSVNSHLINISRFPCVSEVLGMLDDTEIPARLIQRYLSLEDDNEYLFFKQCSAWLGYSLIRSYRILTDHFYDASNSEEEESLSPSLQASLDEWTGKVTIGRIVENDGLTSHRYQELARLEASGNVTRSALFNYWLYSTGGQIGFDRDELLTLMGLTRDLARTVPIAATRTAARLTADEQVKLILLLLLAKRSKNEKDSYQLRKLLVKITNEKHSGSLVELVKSYEEHYPDIADYIYEIATEDFLAKCSGIAPHLSDIPELRAAMHEWMANFTGSEFYLERARAVRIDHQLNRVRNEIDDHRIYVDPSRFSSWINDEVMADLNTALTVVGANKKNATVNCNEPLLSLIVQQCYSAFCSNSVFGISSYIGRRIRHGTFRGHLYSSVIHHLENLEKFRVLRRDAVFIARWNRWIERYDREIKQIITERLHVFSKQKPHGLLQPDNYSAQKLEILSASVRSLVANYTETRSTENLDHVIADYCWRLAEADLQVVIRFLQSKQATLKNIAGLDELVQSLESSKRKPAVEFKREVIHVIDTKLRAMYGWFKRPSNISPKASLALLYDAVVAEVKDTFSNFDPDTQSSDLDDIELIGGAYHVLYDAFYVVVFNAAKHGDPIKPVKRRFSLSVDKSGKRLEIEIASSIHARDRAEEVSQAITQRIFANHDDATLYEQRSGIPKLMQLSQMRKEFNVDFLGVVENEVVVRFSYALEH